MSRCAATIRSKTEERKRRRDLVRSFAGFPHDVTFMTKKDSKISSEIPRVLRTCAFACSFHSTRKSSTSASPPLRMTDRGACGGQGKAPLCKGSSAVGGEGLSRNNLLLFTIPPSRFASHLPLHKGGLRRTTAHPSICHPERRRSRSRTFAGRVKRASKSARPQDARDLAQNLAIFFVIKATSFGKQAKLLTRSLRRYRSSVLDRIVAACGSLPLQNFDFAQDDRLQVM